MGQPQYGAGQCHAPLPYWRRTMLPILDGIEVCSRLRADGCHSIILMLTAKEFALLAYLMEHAGIVFSRAQLLRDVWRMDFDPGTKVVDVYIRYLRSKIEHEGEPVLLHTARGFGYMINVEEKTADYVS